jgi:hypothetical protein
MIDSAAELVVDEPVVNEPVVEEIVSAGDRQVGSH